MPIVTTLPKQVRVSRIEDDLITMSTLSATTSLHRIKQALLAIYARADGGGAINPTDEELSVLFDAAWVIVDRAHMLKKVLEAILGHSPASSDRIEEFLTQAAKASNARDKMDHIHEQISNMAAKTRKKAAPIYGIITASMLDEAQCRRGIITHIDTIILSHSEFHHRVGFKPAVENFFPANGPVDHVRLHAFDGVVDLSKLTAAIVNLTDALDRRKLDPPDNKRRFELVMRATFESPVLGTFKAGTE